MPVGGKPLEVRFVRAQSEIDDSLWRNCIPATLEGRFWYQTLESSGLEDQFGFHYALLGSEGRAIGIVPCFVHDVPISLVAPRPLALGLNFISRWFPRVGLQRTFFIGSPCADEGTIGLVPEVSLADTIGEIAAAVRVKSRELGASMVVFKDFPETALPALRLLCGRGGFFPMVSYPGTVVRLPGPDKEAYFRSLSGMQRHNFRKKLRRSQAALALETCVVRRPSDEELQEVHGLFQQTYARGRTKFERLDLRFFQAVREQEQARFILQRDKQTGALVTFMLVFCLGDRVINKFIGLDYSRAGTTFLYFRLFDAALDFAYTIGAKELQSGQTGYRAKLDLGHRLVPLNNLVRHANPIAQAVYRAIGGRVSLRALDDDLAEFLRAHPERVLRAG